MINKFSKRCVILLFFVLLVASLIRFYGLDQKFYWIDEVSSSYVITGNWPEKIESSLEQETGKIISSEVVLAAIEKNANFVSYNLLSSLAKRDPQHSPLYFLAAQKWAFIFGTQSHNLRMIAAVFGALSIAIFGWLCLEIFSSQFIAFVGSSILALAPFHILYSQQNREYSLWFLMICLSTAVLLAANRSQKKIYWLAYGLSVSAGLYSFLFFLPFLFAHALFQISAWRRSKNQQVKLFIVAATLGFLTFLPWLMNILFRSQKVDDLNQWSSKPVSASIYLQSMVLNASRLFADFNLQSFQPLPISNWPIMTCIVFIFSVIIFSLVYTAKSLSAERKVLFISTFAIPLLFLLSMDALRGGIHALVGRHLMPTWIAVYLAVGFSIGTYMKSAQKRFRLLARIAFGAIIILSIQFNLNYLPEKRWWPLKPQNLADASEEIISSGVNLLVTTFPPETKQLISITYYLDRNFPVLLLEDKQTFPDLKSYQKIAVFRPSENLSELLSKDYSLKQFNEELWLGERK